MGTPHKEKLNADRWDRNDTIKIAENENFVVFCAPTAEYNVIFLWLNSQLLDGLVTIFSVDVCFREQKSSIFSGGFRAHGNVSLFGCSGAPRFFSD